jgi:hypothetical protein
MGFARGRVGRQFNLKSRSSSAAGAEMAIQSAEGENRCRFVYNIKSAKPQAAD